jgi:hypothetical protein
LRSSHLFFVLIQFLFECSRKALPHYRYHSDAKGTDWARRTPNGEILEGPGRKLPGSLRELLRDRDWSQAGLPPTQAELDLADGPDLEKDLGYPNDTDPSTIAILDTYKIVKDK